MQGRTRLPPMTSPKPAGRRHVPRADDEIARPNIVDALMSALIGEVAAPDVCRCWSRPTSRRFDARGRAAHGSDPDQPSARIPDLRPPQEARVVSISNLGATERREAKLPGSAVAAPGPLTPGKCWFFA